jgi:hypothetical protein
MCNDPKCKLLLEMDSNLDFNTVQAVYSVGAAIRAAFSQLCKKNSTAVTDGSCLSRYTRSVEKYVNMTANRPWRPIGL